MRSLKLAALQKTLKTPAVFGDPEGDLLVVGWGSTQGVIEEAVQRLRDEGLKVSSLHLRFIQPMPSGISEILKRFRKVMTIEGNWADRPRGRTDRRGQPPLRGAGDDAALALPGRRRLLDRGQRPADQAGPGGRGAARQAGRMNPSEGK